VTNRDRELGILLACMPKSGSTFLSQIISDIPQMRREQLVPSSHRREQELDEDRISRANNRNYLLRSLWSKGKFPGTPKPIGWIAQHHTRCSQETLALIDKYKVTPVVLVRNIYDIVPSLFDHLTSNSPLMSMAYFENSMINNKDECYEFIVEMIIPWYFNFFVSWKNHGGIKFVLYEELIKDPLDISCGIFEHANIEIEKSLIASAIDKAKSGYTRLNRGISGRGNELPLHLCEKINRYAKFYPNVDFRDIGIDC
jgi:hypothetical protein